MQNNIADLKSEFGRSKAVLSLILNTMLLWLWQRWGHLVTDPFNQPYFTAGRVAGYSQATARTTGVKLQVWGFVDGTVRPICRPSLSQRAFYNGHKRTHALKYQGVCTPDGLITHLFGPIEGRQHDTGVSAESNLLQQLSAHMNAPNGTPYALYGDAAYPLTPYLQKDFQLVQPQVDFNASLNGARTSFEWAFGDISSIWAYITMKNQQKKNLLQPVGLYYPVVALLTNVHTIVRFGNKTSEYFRISPPTVSAYLQ